MEWFDDLMNYDLWNIPIGRIGVFVIVFIVLLIIRSFVVKFAIAYAKKIAKKTKTELDDKIIEVATPPFKLFMFAIIVTVSIEILKLPTKPHILISHIIRSIIIIAIFWGFYRGIHLVSALLEKWTEKTETELDDKIILFVDKVLGIAIITIGGMVVIQEWNYDVTGIVTGLGIGGLAFALAAKDMLSNIFGLLMILSDKPFSMGDSIEAAGTAGTVIDIGFRSTKVKKFDRTVVSIPNSVLANTSITNLTRRDKRRLKFTLGVTYASSISQMKAFISKIKEHLIEREDIQTDTVVVNFSDFGASSLDILVYCFTVSPDWGAFLETQESMKLKIMEIAEELGIGFAFPSQSIYMETEDNEKVDKYDKLAKSYLDTKK